MPKTSTLGGCSRSFAQAPGGAPCLKPRPRTAFRKLRGSGRLDPPPSSRPRPRSLSLIVCHRRLASSNRSSPFRLHPPLATALFVGAPKPRLQTKFRELERTPLPLPLLGGEGRGEGEPLLKIQNPFFPRIFVQSPKPRLQTRLLDFKTPPPPLPLHGRERRSDGEPFLI